MSEPEHCLNKRDAIFAQFYTCVRFALRGWQYENSFTVISEMGDADKFDDIILVTERQGKSEFTLIQQKHHKSTEFDITDERMKNRNSEFYLLKYFKSYLDIRKKFTSTDKEIVGLVIITNKRFANDGDSMEIIKEYPHNSFFRNMSLVLLKFKRDSDFRKPWIDYLISGAKLSNERVDQKDAEEFLNLLVFASENQSVHDQEEITKRVFNKMHEWSDPEEAYRIFKTKMLEKISGCNKEDTHITRNFIEKLFERINVKINSESGSQESM